jgi:hypothetical protein
MKVNLWDRSLTQTYELPVSYVRDTSPRPDPASLSGHADLVVLGGGRGVYRAIPPGLGLLAARAELSRFPGDTATRLVAYVEAPGGPADSMWASWAVADDDRRQVARGSAPLAISACEPTERRVAEFSAAVPPGHYRVDLAVSDGHRRRGLVHLAARVEPPPERLTLSDLVLLCGAPAGDVPVRIEPNLDGRIGGARAVSVYFEADHLAAGPDGRSRFAYTYAVQPASPRGRPTGGAEPVFQATREEEYVGTRRRQFVSAPLKGLKPGTYEVQIELRDLVSGATASRAVQFVKE